MPRKAEGTDHKFLLSQSGLVSFWVFLHLWKSWLLCKENFQKKVKPRREPRGERTVFPTKKRQSVAYSQQRASAAVELYRAALGCFCSRRGSRKCSPCVCVNLYLCKPGICSVGAGYRHPPVTFPKGTRNYSASVKSYCC